MANQDAVALGKALIAARDSLDASLREFVRLAALADDDDHGEPYVHAWLISYEFSAMDLPRQDLAHGRSIISPDDQLTSTSLGLAVMTVKALGG